MLLEMAMWTLITVTNGGNVNESRHATKRLCEEARSIALTGMTIEENEVADRAYADWLKKWDEEHPWRDPKDEWERKLVAGGGSGSVSFGGPYSLSYDGSTGKVREHPGGGMSMSYNSNNGESVDMIRGQWVIRHKTDIKYAKIVPPEKSE
jgi:hypothetical protein